MAYLDTTVVVTGCIAPNGKSFGPYLATGSTLESLKVECLKLLAKYEVQGIDTVEILTGL